MGEVASFSPTLPLAEGESPYVDLRWSTALEIAKRGPNQSRQWVAGQLWSLHRRGVVVSRRRVVVDRRRRHKEIVLEYRLNGLSF